MSYLKEIVYFILIVYFLFFIFYCYNFVSLFKFVCIWESTICGYDWNKARFFACSSGVEQIVIDRWIIGSSYVRIMSRTGEQIPSLLMLFANLWNAARVCRVTRRADSFVSGNHKSVRKTPRNVEIDNRRRPRCESRSFRLLTFDLHFSSHLRNSRARFVRSSYANKVQCKKILNKVFTT